MARRNQNLAGLAALGALGYMLSRDRGAPVEDRVGEDVVRTPAPDAERMLYPDESSGTGEYAPAAPVSRTRSASASAPVTPAMMSQEEMTRRRLAGGPRGRTEPAPTRVAGQGGPRGVLYSPTDTGDETARLARRYPGTAVDRIPGSSPAGWTGGTGERVTGNETTRNLSNIMNATAGLSVPGYVGKMTQAGYNARAAARRAAGDLTPVEVEAARQRITDAAAIGGMKKGGKVKAKKLVVTKSGGKVSSASKRADGIATKGKTRGKLY